MLTFFESSCFIVRSTVWNEERLVIVALASSHLSKHDSSLLETEKMHEIRSLVV